MFKSEKHKLKVSPIIGDVIIWVGVVVAAGIFYLGCVVVVVVVVVVFLWLFVVVGKYL